MTEAEFRDNHSAIIEYYQLIEMKLKGICALIPADEKRDWFERLGDYETDQLWKLITQIKLLQKEKGLTLFSREDFEALDELRKARNYWVHQCFGGDKPVTFRNHVVRRVDHAKRIHDDLETAIEWDGKISEIVRTLNRL